MSEKLVDAMANMREGEALRLAKEMFDSGKDPMEILKLCKQAMDIIGERFEDKEYFLPELVLAGEMLTQITEIVKLRLEETDSIDHLGRIVIGTVHGDLHNIGKNIVAFMLDVNGFNVYDLGEDVPPENFVDKIREVNPEIVGLSCFLSPCFDAMKKTVGAIRESGLRDRLKIMVGGGLVDEKIREYAEADAYRPDPVSAVRLAKEWIGGNGK